MTDWFEMGGYGLYVWGSMIVVVLSVAIELIGLRLRMMRRRLGCNPSIATVDAGVAPQPTTLHVNSPNSKRKE